MVKSENWQALNLLESKYKNCIKLIYIDPPYNTGNDEFIYRDNYRHSSWIAMMSDRLEQSRIFCKKRVRYSQALEKRNNIILR